MTTDIGNLDICEGDMNVINRFLNIYCHTGFPFFLGLLCLLKNCNAIHILHILQLYG